MEKREVVNNTYKEIALHEHLCLMYKSRGEQSKSVVPFIESALEKNFPVIYLSTSTSSIWLKIALESNGININGVKIVNNIDLKKLPKIIDSLPQSYILIDISGKMDSENFPNLVNKCEVQFNNVTEHSNKTILCMYDLNTLNSAIKEDLIYSHSSIIINGKICENIYHITTSELINSEHRVNKMLDHLTKFQKYTQVLIERSLRYKKIYESNMIAVVFISKDGTFIEANDTFLKLTGYSQQDINAGAINWKTLIPFEQHHLVFKALKELKKSQIYQPFEVNFKKKNGEELTVMLGGALIDADKEEYIGFALDLTELKILEKRRDDFLSTASHELKTPLTTLKAFSDLLTKHIQETKNPKKFALYLDKMDKQINKLTGLVRDLLDVSKMKSGKLEYNDEVLSIDNLIKEVVSNTQLTTWKHKINIKGKSYALIYADSFRIAQVLSNLLSNAIKYSPKSGNIIVTIQPDGKNIMIGVKDSGIGIPKDKQELLFKRFDRVYDKKRESYPGLGIGLFIAAEIISRYNGKIWLTSEEGRGSNFYFTIPVYNVKEVQ